MSEQQNYQDDHGDNSANAAGNTVSGQAQPGEGRQETNANSIWSRMLAGNRRFAQGAAEHPWQDKVTRESLIDGQNPGAAVLSCSDSRVPPEIIFDQGLGDMFTIRTAGQTLDDAVIASIEFAISQLHVSLLVVLGHEGCGAVQAAVAAVDEIGVRQLDSPVDAASTQAALFEQIAASDSIIVRSVGFSVQQARSSELHAREDYERVHVAHTIEELAARSEVIRQALSEQRIMVVGARYLLSTGVVEVLSF